MATQRRARGTRDGGRRCARIGRPARPAVPARAAVAALALATAATQPAAAQQTPSSPTLGACTTVTATASVFATAGPPITGWTENLGFDGHGGMWVSDLFDNQLVRYDSSGTPSTTISLPSPGAVLPGPGGMMYAGFGDNDLDALFHTGAAGVVRFDPLAGDPQPTVYASGVPMVNGAAFDAAGNLYTADTLGGTAITRFAPGGVRDPSFQADGDIAGPNGLAVVGGELYATSLTDPLSGLFRIPLDDPSAHVTVAQLTWVGIPFLPKFLDDLAVGPDGFIYVASAVGDLFRVNPVTGAACVAWSGVPITSIRFVRGFPPFHPDTDAFMTSETGEILHIHFTFRHAS